MSDSGDPKTEVIVTFDQLDNAVDNLLGIDPTKDRAPQIEAIDKENYLYVSERATQLHIDRHIFILERLNSSKADDQELTELEKTKIIQCVGKVIVSSAIYLALLPPRFSFHNAIVGKHLRNEDKYNTAKVQELIREGKTFPQAMKQVKSEWDKSQDLLYTSGEKDLPRLTNLSDMQDSISSWLIRLGAKQNLRDLINYLVEENREFKFSEKGKEGMQAHLADDENLFRKFGMRWGDLSYTQKLQATAYLEYNGVQDRFNRNDYTVSEIGDLIHYSISILIYLGVPIEDAIPYGIKDPPIINGAIKYTTDDLFYLDAVSHRDHQIYLKEVYGIEVK